MSEKSAKEDPSDLSNSTAVNDFQKPSPEQEKSSGVKSKTAGAGGHQPSGKPAGPRTPHGKEISKHNATTHGIFSKVIVLPGESHEEYDSLLKGFVEARKPADDLEFAVVEKLAIIRWRQRRVLQAERAEIQYGRKFAEWDRRMRQINEAEIAKRITSRLYEGFSQRPGLLPDLQNPEILEYALKLLLELREGIKSRGFNYSADNGILDIIYGYNKDMHGTLRNAYRMFSETAAVKEEERKRKGYMTVEQCKDKILSAIDAEIQLFEKHRQKLADMESERTELELLRRGIPEGGKADC